MHARKCRPRRDFARSFPRLERLEDRTLLASSNTPAFLLLDPSSKGALSVTGQGGILGTGGAVVVIDSANAQAAVASGKGSVSAAEFDITGSPGFTATGQGTFQGSIHSGVAPAADPLATLPVPQAPAATFGAVNYSGKDPLTLSPGTYVGGIKVSGQGSVTLLPGLYYLKGGGLAVTGQGGFSGDGVVIYNDGGSGISFSGGGDVRLTPPTAGTYQDITLFQDRSSATAISLSGNGGLNITGTVYAAHAKLSVTGNGGLTAPSAPSAITEYVVYDLSVTGKGGVTADASYNQPLAVTASVSPAPKFLSDGTPVTNAAQSVVSGTTKPGAQVDLETGSDGLFDDGHTTADASGHYSFAVTLAEGPNVLQVRATSRFDQQVIASAKVTLDTVPPTITGSRAPAANADGWNNADVVVSFSAGDNLGLASVSGPVTLSGEGAGQSATGTASDVAGNSASATVGGINIDKTAPATAATPSGTAGLSGWYLGPVAVGLAATDNLAGVRATYYALDGGAAQTYGSSIPVSGDGTHTLSYWSVDRADNEETHHSLTVRIDTAPPALTIASPAPGLLTNHNVTVSGQVTDATSGVLSLQAQVDAGAPFGVAFDASGNYSFVTALPLDGTADGGHTVHLRATDQAGNASGSFDVSFTLDTLPPVIRAGLADDTAPGGGTNTDGVTSDPTVSGTVTDASPVAVFRAGLDGTTPANFIDVLADRRPDGSFTLTPAQLGQLLGGVLADGPHTLHLQAADSLGNTSAVYDLPFTLDTQPPALSASRPPALTNHNVTVTGQVTDALSGVAALTAQVDGGPATNVSFDPQTGAFSFTTSLPLDHSADGSHTIHLVGTDVAGNAVTRDLSFTLDTIPPVVPAFDLSSASVTPDSASVPHQTAAARVTLVGHTDPNVTVTLLPAGATTLSSTTGAFQFPGVTLAVGGNPFTVQAQDAAGNVSSYDLTVTRVAAAARPNAVIVWNQAALSAIQTDGTDPLFASRGLAMVQAAVYDAVNAIEGSPAYYVKVAAPAGATPDTAVDAAAHDVLAYLYPAQQATFDALLAAQLALLPANQATSDGQAVGRAAAAAIIALRANDGSRTYANFIPGTAVGNWQPTAPAYAPALDPQWGSVTPFALTSPGQFAPGGPPALTSQQWADAVNQTESLGAVNSTTRTADQTQIAQFWNDATGTATPPGHWNAIAETVAQQTGDSLADDARLFATLDVALADAGITAWNAKYTTDAWRPITVIQGGGAGVNPAVTADPSWYPLLTTPNFPEYVSGHSTFSAAAATVLGAFFGSNVSFTTTEPTLPGVVRSFTSFDQAAQEAGLSRIYAGIHFAFSNVDGQAAGQNVASYVLRTFDIKQDTIPPKVALNNVLPSGASNTNVTITGQATDNLSGVAKLEVQVDGGAYAPLSFDPATGNFSFTTPFALDGTTDGKHTVNFRATDAAGNVATPSAFAFTLDTQAPVLALTSPADGGSLADGALLTGTVTSGSALVCLCYAFDGSTTLMPVVFNADGSFSQALNLSKLAAGSHALMVKAQDAAGNVTTQTLHLNMAAPIVLTVTSVTPADGASEVGVTFRPKVTFSRPINTATLTTADFYATDPNGAVIPATVVPANDGTYAWLYFTGALPGASAVTLLVDGSKIKAADGSLLDAAGNGVAGSKLTATFTTVNQATIPGTTLSGVLADPGPDLKPMTRDDVRNGADGILGTADDVYLRPIEGVKVYILGHEGQAVTTDAQGGFSFSSVPSGDVKLAMVGNVPGVMVYDPDQQQFVNPNSKGFYFPEMVMDLNIQPGVANTVMGTMGTREEQAANATNLGVYLPRLQSAILQTVSNTQPTTVGVPAQAAPDLTPEQRQFLTATVQPNSAIGMDGEVMDDVQIGISTVPTSLIKDMLPAGVPVPPFTITVQAPGVTTFTTPVTLTFPNVTNAAPGTKLEFMSFDHTTGRLEVEGTATVSADGLSVVTDPDSGLTHPGWHFVIQGSPAKFEVGSKEGNQGDPGIGKGPDFDMSNGLFQSIDGAFNAVANAIPNLLSHIPGLGGLANPFNLTPVQSAVDALIRECYTQGAASKGGNLGIVTQYYESFMSGGGVDPASPALLQMVRNDPSVKQNLEDLKTDVKELVDEAIQEEIADGNGVLDLNNVRDRVANGLAGLAGYILPVLNSNGTLLLVIDNTQKATLEIDHLQATGHIIGPDVGGTGTWMGKLIYTLSDDFGFDPGDVSRTFQAGLAALGDATIEVGEASVSAARAGAELAGGDLIDAAIDALDAYHHLQAAETDFHTFATNVAAASCVEIFRLDQLYGKAKPYIDVFPVDTDISGDFTIPPGYQDVVIIPDPPDVHGNVGPTAGQIPISTVSGFGSSNQVHYRIALDNGFEITGVIGSGTPINDLVLPPNKPFVATFYAPQINSSLRISGTASPSGLPTLLGQDRFEMTENPGLLKMTTFGGPDSDGDGIPDVGEYVLGTDPHKFSTTNDNIGDGAKLAAGLDPLSGIAFPTGVVASLPIPGTVEKLAVAGNRIYAAAGSSGLAVVDGGQFNNPILLGRLALPGNATGVGVDDNLMIAAVATGSALQLVDVSNGMAPTLLHSVAVPASQVVVSNGIAYAASGNKLTEVDLESGNVLQSLTLPMFTVTGLARDGTFLYAYGGGTFAVIDISTEGAAAVRGSLGVSIASSDVGVFAANGVAWLSGSGLRTIDVSDPAHPHLLHQPSGSDFVNARRFALNGSGLGVLVPDGATYMEVYDTSNPNVTPPRLLQLPVSSGTRVVAISRGIAYIGENGRIEVVNYLPFDNKGVPPTVSINTSAPDVDLIKPGLQVLEGSTLPIQVTASDDVQVAKVELLVNGQVVQTDVAYPFDFFAVAPTVAQSGDTFTIQVRATDTGGNVGLSNVLTVGLENDTSPPTITGLSPANGSSLLEGQQVVRVTFSKALDPATVTATNFQLLDGSNNVVTASNIQVRDNDRLVQLTFASLQPGSYQLVINGPAVTDRVGHPLSTGHITDSFTLTPRETLTVSNADADPATPGLQLYEGTTVHGTVTVDPSVSVQEVDVLFNGQVVATGTAAPFSFSAVAPLLRTGPTSFTLQTRVTDTTGAATVSGPLNVGLLKDVTPPTVVSTGPANNGKTFKGLTSVQVTFSEPVAVATAIPANFQLVEAGPDGLFGDGAAVPISAVSTASDDTVMQLTTAPLAPGAYQVQVQNAAITDRAGNPVGTGVFTSTFTVLDRPGLNDLLNLRGTPVTGNVVLSSDKLTVGINPDGSLITSDAGVGLVFDGKEFIIWGTPLESFTIARDGNNFTNGAPALDSAIGVTMEDLSTGTFHGVRIVGTVGGNMLLERVITFNDGDPFITMATRLTNLTTTDLNNVAWLENADPDQGIAIGSGFSTSNDVVLGGQFVRASVTTAAYPGGLTMGFGSADPRAVASAEGFVVTNPFDVINSPVDPNGAGNDIAINLAFNYGTLAGLSSVTCGLILALGKSTAEADVAYERAAPITGPAGSLPPPAITSISPAAGQVRSAAEGLDTVQVNFSQPMDPASITAANFTLVEAGPDGTFGDADDVPVALNPGGPQLDSSAATALIITAAPLGPGDYRLRVSEAGITDIFGDPLGGGTLTSEFHVVPSTARLYGVTSAGGGASTLYSIDPSTGTSTRIGPVGFNHVSGMAIRAGGTLYATGDRPADGTPVLLTINTATGAGTEVGPLGSIGDPTDISFRNADNALFASYDFGTELTVINTATGQATPVGSNDVDVNGGNALAFSPADRLLLATGNILATLDPATGASTTSLGLNFPVPATTFARVNAMDFVPGTDSLFGVLNTGFGAGATTFIVTMDWATGLVVTKGPAVNGLDALAWGPAAVPPAGLPQFLAGSPKSPGGDAADLSHGGLSPVIGEALKELAAAGYDISGLSGVQFQVADLPESLLGLTYQNTVWIDRTAQGYGWYTDASPSSSAAFTQMIGAHELQATPGSPAYGRVDLLTVVTHELGHVLGFASIDAGLLGHDWMTATLGAGVRRYPDAAPGGEQLPQSAGRVLEAVYQVLVGRPGALGGALPALIGPPVRTSTPSAQEGPVTLLQRPGVDQAETLPGPSPSSAAASSGLQAGSLPIRALDALLEQRRLDLPLRFSPPGSGPTLYPDGQGIAWMTPMALARIEFEQTDGGSVGRMGPKRQQPDDDLLAAVFGTPLLLDEVL